MSDFTFPHEVAEHGEGDGLDALYANASMLAPGYTMDYRGYTLEKVDTESPIGPSDHTEFYVVAPHGARIETVTVAAFDGPERLRAFLNRIVAYGPTDASDWLNRGSA